MMVLDASAVVEWLLAGRRGQAVAEALDEDPDGVFMAPDLIDAEVVQVFRRLVRTGTVTPARASASVALLKRMPLDRRPTLPLVPRMWALRENLTAHDATYVALAEALECPLLTCDARIRDAPGHTATIRVVGRNAGSAWRGTGLIRVVGHGPGPIGEEKGPDRANRAGDIRTCSRGDPRGALGGQSRISGKCGCHVRDPLRGTSGAIAFFGCTIGTIAPFRPRAGASALHPRGGARLSSPLLHASASGPCHPGRGGRRFRRGGR